MTVKSILSDPIVDRVTAVFGDGEVVEGQLSGYNKQMDYLGVGEVEKWDPVEIDIHDNSVLLRRVPAEKLSHFPYSGRDYRSIDYGKKVNSLPGLRRTPAVLQEDGGYFVVEGNSFLSGFLDQSVENELWVREFDYSREEALDNFLGDHFPFNDEELEARTEGKGWYTDEEIERSLENLYPALGSDFDVSYMEKSKDIENYPRLEFNLERFGYDSSF